MKLWVVKYLKFTDVNNVQAMYFSSQKAALKWYRAELPEVNYTCDTSINDISPPEREDVPTDRAGLIRYLNATCGGY